MQAFHTFAWATAWLGDPDLVAGEGAAAHIVDYIRADETPHVGYLATAITEMRDRTWIGESGKRYAGADMIGRIWEVLLDQSIGSGRAQSLAVVTGEVQYWCDRHANGAEVLEGFHALASGSGASAPAG